LVQVVLAYQEVAQVAQVIMEPTQFLAQSQVLAVVELVRVQLQSRKPQEK